ncbi:enoyl-CoA hydratase [Haladaptatus paucihalophilus DX253]|uniref:Enoyl-CoA hydratase n=1 Tax=Haladaptatus paucihalophilus DX253 TaxID=797209 RepID=E7QP55_HALPU|nr:enoyl-CoA hydratase/isomerase family protein [Haladaptatus paucihalophilus]EFW93971.1 enoyl-CoA hydratase [Haladaptatus paucihalophilus DX253]SHK65473.1 Enoyl-CoA hydratase/carnithine racemase [Haladaptatus paucihalophilus DX253]
MIRVTDDPKIRIVTIDRPERRNALTLDGLDALSEAVREAAQPVVYLRGAGTAFCAGADLDVVAGLDDESATELATSGQRVANDIEDAESVVVAGIDGAARGGGVELALACDVRVATPDATFAEPGVRLGIFGAWGGTTRLPEIVGMGDALDLALTGRVVTAEDAHRMGLVSRVVAQPRKVADRLAANDPDALRVVKGRVRDRSSTDVQLAREAESFGELVAANADDIAARRE